MIWIDYAILAVIGISGVISLMRGFVKEALSLAGWIAAFWIAIAFSGRGAAVLEGYVNVPSWRVAIAFVVLLIVVLVACGIVLRMAGLLVEKTGMSGTDRSLGIVFGVLRGIAIAGLLVLLAGLTSLPRDPWWSRSLFVPHFVELAQEVLAYFSEDIQREFNFEPEPGAEAEPEAGTNAEAES